MKITNRIYQIEDVYNDIDNNIDIQASRAVIDYISERELVNEGFWKFTTATAVMERLGGRLKEVWTIAYGY